MAKGSTRVKKRRACSSALLARVPKILNQSVSTRVVATQRYTGAYKCVLTEASLKSRAEWYFTCGMHCLIAGSGSVNQPSIVVRAVRGRGSLLVNQMLRRAVAGEHVKLTLVSLLHVENVQSYVSTFISPIRNGKCFIVRMLQRAS